MTRRAISRRALVTGLGAVGIVDEQIFAARTFKKGDARPGGYRATGGHGGVLGSACEEVRVWFRPAYRTTGTSALAVGHLPAEVTFQEYGDSPEAASIRIKDDDGSLRGEAIAPVHIVKYGHYMAEEDTSDPAVEVDIMARIERGLAQEASAEPGAPRFHGFVLEGAAGTGSALHSQMAALAVAAYHGMPVARVSRGDPEGALPSNPNDLTIEGTNLDRHESARAAARGHAAPGAFAQGARPTQPDSTGARGVARGDCALPGDIRHTLALLSWGPLTR